MPGVFPNTLCFPIETHLFPPAPIYLQHYQRDADGLSIQYTVSEQDFEESMFYAYH